jgi:hypothetical protein
VVVVFSGPLLFPFVVVRVGSGGSGERSGCCCMLAICDVVYE